MEKTNEKDANISIGKYGVEYISKFVIRNSDAEIYKKYIEE